MRLSENNGGIESLSGVAAHREMAIGAKANRGEKISNENGEN